MERGGGGREGERQTDAEREGVKKKIMWVRPGKKGAEVRWREAERSSRGEEQTGKERRGRKG